MSLIIVSSERRISMGLRGHGGVISLNAASAEQRRCIRTRQKLVPSAVLSASLGNAASMRSEIALNRTAPVAIGNGIFTIGANALCITYYNMLMNTRQPLSGAPKKATRPQKRPPKKFHEIQKFSQRLLLLIMLLEMSTF